MRLRRAVHVHLTVTEWTHGKCWDNRLQHQVYVAVPDFMARDAETLDFYGAFAIAEQFWAMRQKLTEVPAWWTPGLSKKPKAKRGLR